MALTIGAILALLGIAVALYPFLRYRFFGQSTFDDLAPPDVAAADVAEAAPEELEAIYQSIRTLQLERELGNIPEGLYREQLNGYRMQAARLLRELEQKSASGGDWTLEEEIRVARSGLYGGPAGGLPCPNCGRPAPAGAGDCPECGAALPPQSETRLPSIDE